MGRWMFSVCIMVVEAWGNVYFFDTFLGRKKGIFFCRYRFPAYLAMMFAASTAGYWIDMWKLPVYILGYILLGRVCYQAGWIQGIYFSMLNKSFPICRTISYYIEAYTLINRSFEFHFMKTV